MINGLKNKKFILKKKIGCCNNLVKYGIAFLYGCSNQILVAAANF